MNQFAEMAVTGIGVVAPTGTTKQAFFDALCDASSPERSDDATPAPRGQLLNQLRISDPKLKIARYMDPTSKNVIVALGEAMADAGIEDHNVAQSPHNYSIVLGTTRGASVTRNGLHESLLSRHGKMVSGTLFSQCGYNIAGAMAAIAYGIKGPNLTVTGRRDIGLCILRRARQILVTERAHTVFAGFSECDGDGAVGTTSPFGECAYILCLERMVRAAGRHAAVLAEVSLQDEAKDTAQEFRGWHRRETALAESAEAHSVALPCLPSVRGRYDALIKIGLLSHNTQLRDQFPAVAFSAGAGGNRARVKVLHAREETFAA